MIGWLKNLLKDSLVYGIGFGISRFLQIIVLPLIAHALSLSEYGYYSNYVIFYTIASGVLVLGLDNSVARFMFDSDDKSYHRKLFSIAFFCLLSVSLLFALISSFFPYFFLAVINVPVGKQQALPYVMFTIPALVLNNFFLTWFKWNRQKYFFLMNTIGTVVFLLVPLLLVKKITFLVVFQVIFFSQSAVTLMCVVVSSNYLRPVFNKALFISMLKYGFPWMLVFFLGLSRSYLDRFFLTRYLSENSYGIYNFSTRLATLLSLAITAFEMSFGPLAFSIWNKESAPRFFARLQSSYIFFLGTLACVIVILSPLLVEILGGKKYHGAEIVLPYLLFSAIPLTLINFSGMGILYVKKSFLSTITLIIGFITVLLLNMILTPRYLQFGAVNASLIGHLIIVIAGYLLSQRYYKIPFHFAKDGFMFFFLLTLSILFVEIHVGTNIYQDMVIKALALTAIVIVLVLSLFQDEYKRSFSFLKNLAYAGFGRNAGV